MSAPVSTRDAVGAALLFVRREWRTIGVIALIGAAAGTTLNLISLSLGHVAPQLASITLIAVYLLNSAIYAALTGRALHVPGALSQRLAGDAARVFLALAVLTLLFMIVMVVLVIPMTVLLSPVLRPYMPALQAAQNNQTQVMALAQQFAQENPGPLLAIMVVFCGAFLLLTSRFYLAAPASVSLQRILSLESWVWTKNNMLRITGARLMLLGPGFIFMFALTMLLGRAFGIDVLQNDQVERFANANPLGYGIVSFVAGFVSIAFYNSLEAGLSSALYQRLKPNTAAVFS